MFEISFDFRVIYSILEPNILTPARGFRSMFFDGVFISGKPTLIALKRVLVFVVFGILGGVQIAEMENIMASKNSETKELKVTDVGLLGCSLLVGS